MAKQEDSFWIEKVIFRQAARNDLPSLEWNGEYQHFRQIYQDVYFLVQRDEATIWVAELPGVELIGQALVQLKSARFELADGTSRAYIFGFRIKPDYRNCGIGSRMMEIIEANLISRGYEWAILNVNQDNCAARKLYERLGYQVLAVEPGNWSYINDIGEKVDVNEPAWRMGKKLT